MSPTRRFRLPWQVSFVLLAAIWGMSFVFIEEADQALSATEVALARLAVGSATLLIILALQREPLPRGRNLWLHMAVAAAILNVVPFTLFAFAETHISSGLAGIWNATTPLFTMVVSMLALADERPTRNRITGLALGFLGVVVVLGPWRSAGRSDLLLGSAAAITASAFYGIGYPYARRFLTGRPNSVVAISAGQLICATLEVGLITALFPRASGHITVAVVGSVLALGALGTGIAYVLNHAVVRAAGATTTSTVTYLIPVFAVLAGVLLLKEQLTWNEPVGALVILLGVGISQNRLRVGLGRPALSRPDRPSGTASRPRHE